MDGTVVDAGRADGGMPAGLDLLGVVCGSEGQLGVVTEATLRILPKPEGARPVLVGFDSPRWPGPAWPTSSGRHPAGGDRIHGPPLHPRLTEAFAHAGYPDCEALLIIEVEGTSEAEIAEQLARDPRDRQPRHDPVEFREAGDEDEAKRIWLGRKSAFGAMGQINDYMCLDGTIPVSVCPCAAPDRRDECRAGYGLEVAMSSMPATATCTR
jgi:glycolate oxidase